MAERERRLLWSPEAEADLGTIWAWGASHFSPETADAHIRDIMRSAEMVRSNPMLGRERADLLPAIRSIVVYPTILFYRSGDEAVEIVRVVDGRRNLAAIFREEE